MSGKRNDLIFDADQYPLIKKFDGQRVHPKDLRPDPVLNGRVELPDVAKFKADFLNPKIGQIQSLTIGKLDGIPTIIDGVTRWRAAMEITEEGIGPHEGGAFFLKCTYSPARTAMDRFLLTVKANIRNDPKPADIAHSIAIFLHQFQQSEEFIAADVYGRYTLDGKPDVDWVRECNALNDLTPESLDALKSGRVNSKAAIALSKLTPERQRQKLAETPTGQKLTVAAIKRPTIANGAGPAASAAASSTQTTSDPLPTPPAKRKWDKQTVCDKLQEWIDMSLPPHIARMDAENAIRTVLGQIQEEIQCGK